MNNDFLVKNLHTVLFLSEYILKQDIRKETNEDKEKACELCLSFYEILSSTDKNEEKEKKFEDSILEFMETFFSEDDGYLKESGHLELCLAMKESECNLSFMRYNQSKMISRHEDSDNSADSIEELFSNEK